MIVVARTYYQAKRYLASVGENPMSNHVTVLATDSDDYSKLRGRHIDEEVVKLEGWGKGQYAWQVAEELKVSARHV